MTKHEKEELTIIGIGSSAGGLEAIRELVATLPADLPVTYVVVQHMSPHHKSLMTELVTRQTNLRVADITDGLIPEANVVYITPPKTDVILKDGALRLVAHSDLPAAPKPSVDRFLRSLADDHGDKTMAMILSGTGSDGSYGVQAIREAGGITIAQDFDSAKYDGMPHSAVQTGCVDLVLRPQEIGVQLQKILTSPRDFAQFHQDAFSDNPITDILQILLARTRVDFRDYKQTTITRRIDRRMVALGIKDQEEYTQFLRNNPQAVDALFKDLLISVTRFFRDKEEFSKLKELLPELIEQKGDGPLRVWIAGCATGEEAYSVAMLIAEAMGGNTTAFNEKVQIFATDIDKDALQIARRGVYGTAVLSEIPPTLARKYLTQHGDSVQVVDSLRAAILFSDHNVCQDPPFQKVDLLCCRNLLIYFGNSLQRKVMTRFHYALAPNGLLFLGTAESASGSDELFLADNTGPHAFRKRTLLRGAGPYRMPTVPTYTARESEKGKTSPAMSNEQMYFEALVQTLGENSILVSQDQTIQRVYGTISPYIEVTELTNLKMHTDLLKSPLREEARSLVAISMKNKSHRSGMRHKLPGNDDHETQIHVYPIVAPKATEKLALVVFTKVPVPASPREMENADTDLDETVAARISELENEVAVTREALQQTIEELETSNEELQSLNEEMQSTNEELQATNEELETSNEELQSTNEELITVNEELQITATELSGRTGELTSVLQSTPLAIIVTDSALQITQATDAAIKLFGIKTPIMAPHISQCNLQDGYPALAPICNDALKLGETRRHEFTSLGTQVMLNCSPYFDVNGKILGVTMVVTEFPGLASEMEMILNTDHIHLMNRAQDGEILRISKASAATFGLTREDALGRNMFDLIDKSMVPKIRESDAKLLAGDISTETTTYRFSDSEGKDIWLAMERYAYFDRTQDTTMIYNIASDITEIVDAFDKTEDVLRRFRQLQELAGYGYWELDPVNRDIYWSSKVFELHGVPEEDGEPAYEDAVAFYHPDDIPEVQAAVDGLNPENDQFAFTARLQQGSGNEITVNSRGQAILNAKGEIKKIVGTFVEVDGSVKH